MAHTPQQMDIHAAFRTKDSLNIIAGAGTGKTTTIVQGEMYLPHSTLFLAFNKSIADELKLRMPHRNCKTFHAIALSNLQQRIGKRNVDAYKYVKLAEAAGHTREEGTWISEAVSLFQLSEEGVYRDVRDWDSEFFMDVCGPEIQLLDRPEGTSMELPDCVYAALELLKQELVKPTAWTFDDMLFMVAYYANTKRWFMQDYDCIVVDEAQDVSPIRLDILKRLSKRCIAVGDPKQAIYKFAGAMTDALLSIKAAFKSKDLPLSVTWRCDQAIIDEAAHIVGPYLEPRPGAGEGLVSRIDVKTLFDSRLTDDTMVLCRTNAPLLKLALKMLARRNPFNLVSDYPGRLAKKAERLSTGIKGMAAFRTAVHDYYQEKLDKVKSEGLKARLEDERDGIYTVADVCQNPQDVSSKFEALMRCKTGPVLTTGHKAKGLEAGRAILIRPDLTPAPWVDTEDEESMQQELNLKYVMITRAKREFIYADGEF